MNKLKESKFFIKISSIWNNRFFSIVFIRLAFLAVLLNIVVEALSRHSLLKVFIHIGTRPYPFLYNCLLIFFTLTIACFFRKRIFVTSFISILWLIMGIVNCIILSFRKTPFTAPDVLNIGDCMKVLPKYFNTFQVVLVILLIVVAVGLIVMVAVKSPKVKDKINYLKAALASAVSFGALMLLINIGTGTGLLATNFGNIGQAYRDYGFGYCFTASVFNSGIEKPKDYSKDKVDNLVEEVETSVEDALDNSAEVTPTEPEDYPNIIFVQLESEFDPFLVKDLKFSQDPIPNLHKLYREYSSGYLSVPAFGAGTANTEFEVITGMNLDDFGPGEYPYKTVLRNNACESICYYLKNYGYTTNALHDNEGDFYSRNTVFSRLGFDTFTSIEYINGVEENPTGWAKDACLTDEILGILDASEGQDYVYTISVQGHGDYPEDTTDFELPIKVTNNDVTGNPDGFEYYVNQVYEMDQLVGDLIAKLSARQEKTVVVFYGDHLPTFDFTDETLENGDIYQTEYVIWNNFGLEKQDEDVQAFQLSSVVMSRLGLVGGVISKYHLTTMNTLDQDTYLSNLKLLEYDILYGDCDAYDGVNPYSVTNMVMGYKDIKIINARNIVGHAIVTGENFTQNSVVRINGEDVSTTFSSENELILDEVELEDGDSIAVVQETSDDGDELSSTSIYVFRQK